MKIVVGASSFAATSDKAINMLIKQGAEVVKNPYGHRMNEEEIIKHLDGADGLLAGLEPLNENVLSKAPNLKAIARIGIGTDNVDFDACKRHGIKVSNTPDAPTAAVAEMALAALLTIAHNIIPCNRDIHNGEWTKRIGFSLIGLNVLIVGYGRIGRRFAEHLKSLGSNIIVYDPFQPDISEPNLEQALAKADVISLHAAGADMILSAEMFDYMKDGVVILNCARGGLIDEEALYNNLTSGMVSYFWGDVFSKEPYSGKLTECENAILTPHISTYNSLCRESMETEAVINIMEDLGIDTK